MKRIAIFSFLAVFLFTNYAYATITTEELTQAMEKAQQGELTQEEAEDLFIRLISSVDMEGVMAGDFSSMESIVQPDQYGLGLCLTFMFIFVFGYFMSIFLIDYFIAAVASFAYFLFLFLC